ncbi:MAG TPA: DUF5818 domain-containing protein [Terriglobales bacterium]|nr:DUF5818 domain-containing protein [Terriglobales bacterium]
MKREIITLIGLAFFLLVSSWAFSQTEGPQPCPDVIPGTLGCEPVAWSQLQEPVPLPEPGAEPAPPPDQESSQSTGSQDQPATAKQSIKGIIVRQGEKFVLNAGDNTTYQLDDQNKAKQYQDKQVNVVGILDAESNTLHIETIELAS